MKSKLVISAIVMTAALGGYLAGFYFTSKSWAAYFMRYSYMEHSNEAQEITRALTYLREDQESEAADMMELYLDSDLITFISYPDKPAAERPDFIRRAARVARDYRAKYPHTNSEPTVEEAIQKVYRLAD